MKKTAFIFLWLLYGPLYAQITVDATKSFLQEKGKPFFWLADTGWELFHRLSREEAVHYLDVRQQQDFNVIMAVALGELDGIRQPNYYGDRPFKSLDPLQWDETPGNDPADPAAYDYWDHVDFVIREAAKRKICIGLLPTWGDKVVPGAAGPVIFTDPEIAYRYAKKLAARYKAQKNLVWILGGDRQAITGTVDYRPVWRAMAKAIQEVMGRDAFIAYHPRQHTSAHFKQQDAWLSINAIQSGHAARDIRVWDLVSAGLEAVPKRPFMDLEPCYEDHPVFPWDGKWTRAGRGYFSDYDVRARIYRGVFSGGCGAVYGHHQVWQFTDTNRNKPVFIGDTLIGWKKAIQSPGAWQMQYLKKLMQAHPDFHREADSLLIASDRGANYQDRIIATRNQKRTYALIYLPQPRAVQVNLNRLQQGPKEITWLNPATGVPQVLPQQYNGGLQTFDPPDKNQKDWVLVIDTRANN